ncbi:BPTI/Kunitz domain-containing protein-like [Amblyomma americanum]
MGKVQGHFVCVFWLALAAAVISRPEMLAEPKSNKNKCVMPTNDYDGRCLARVPRYFFNKTAGVCQYILWNGCLSDGLFEKRFECAKQCGNQYEEGDVCLLYRPGVCTRESYQVRSRYFYNHTTKECKQYYMCENMGPELSANSFHSLVFCNMHCSGFVMPQNASAVAEKLRSLGRLPFKELFQSPYKQ